MAETSKRNNSKKRKARKFLPTTFIIIVLFFGILTFGNLIGYFNPFPAKYNLADNAGVVKTLEKVKDVIIGKPDLILDKDLYDQKMALLANNPVILVATSTVGTTSSTSKKQATSTHTTSSKPTLWPAKPNVYPIAGAILPFNRIVAYYGNFYSKGMGVLGQYPPEEMLQRLNSEVEKWQAADPGTPVIPAIHYIAVTAQGAPGGDGKYRLRMPAGQIEKAISLAKEVNGLVFLDIQVGLSNLQSEVPLLEKYLREPNVHLAVDPEFSMKTGAKPGTVIGTMDAADINYATKYLANLVKENHLPPKILVVHRFTENMVTNTSSIEPLPEVQIVMDMDGWGPQAKKIGTYKQVIYPYPVQFAGFKLFYKNDILTASSTMLSPKQVLMLRPRPIYIQYQ